MFLHNSPYKLFEDLLFADQNTNFFPFHQKDNSFEAILEVPGFNKIILKWKLRKITLNLTEKLKSAAKNELSADATNCRKKQIEKNYPQN